MTIYSGIFNSVNGDRKYNAWWFAKYFSTFIGNGVFPNPSSNLQVAAYQNMKVVVKPGSGWIDGYFIYSDGDHVLSLDVADGVLKRIDRVVMRLNHLTRKIEIVVKKGAFASSPVAPTLQRDTDAYELALADVSINNGATQITQANITDQRLNSTLCGIVHGTVNQVDTTTIFNQYQAWFESIKDSVASEIYAWQEVQEQEFLTWFESIKDILEGDVAGNLASRIAALEIKVDTHVKDMVRHNNYGTATGTNTLTLTASPAITTLIEGLTIRFKNTTANTGAVTLNVNGLGAKAVRKNGGVNLSAGNLKAGGIYTVCYDGASFILQGEGGEYGTAGTGDVRSGKTLGTENGIISGTLDLSKVIPENIRKDVVIDGKTGTLLPSNGNTSNETAIKNALKRRVSITDDYMQTDDGGYMEFTYSPTMALKKYNIYGTLMATYPLSGYPGGVLIGAGFVEYDEFQISAIVTNLVLHFNWSGILTKRTETTNIRSIHFVIYDINNVPHVIGAKNSDYYISIMDIAGNIITNAPELYISNADNSVCRRISKNMWVYNANTSGRAYVIIAKAGGGFEFVDCYVPSLVSALGTFGRR